MVEIKALPLSYCLNNSILSSLFYIVNLILSIIYQSLWDRSCTYTHCITLFDVVHLQVKRTIICLLI
jgi:hypothetical protein